MAVWCGGMPTGTVSVLVNGTIANVVHPQSLAVDNRGYLSIADPGANGFFQVSPPFNANPLNVTFEKVLLGGNAATPASPTGIVVDNLDNVYIVDAATHGFYFAPSPAPGAAFSALGQVLVPNLGEIDGLAMDAGRTVYFPDKTNSYLTTYNLDSAETISYPGISGLYAPSGIPTSPSGVAVDPMGQVYLANTGSSQVEMLMLNSVSLGHVQLGSATTSPVYLHFTMATGDVPSGLAWSYLGALDGEFSQSSATLPSAFTLFPSRQQHGHRQHPLHPPGRLRPNKCRPGPGFPGGHLPSTGGNAQSTNAIPSTVSPTLRWRFSIGPAPTRR